jgi:Ala-tRNA(Pro) deacylase
MIPVRIQEYLREHQVHFVPHLHRRAVAAQRWAATEHTPGRKVAKVVVARVDGRPVLAVVAADQRLDLERLRRTLAAHQAALASEESFEELFAPCEAGAEPPLALFGLPIYADARLALEPFLLMRGGTHEDSVLVDTDDWVLSERVRIIDGLGRSQGGAAHLS